MKQPKTSCARNSHYAWSLTLVLIAIAVYAHNLDVSLHSFPAPERSQSSTRDQDLGSIRENGIMPRQESPVLLNDPAIASSWGLQAVDAQRAWRITTGDKRIVVAVIDTGIDVEHPDLKENLWTNSGESGLDAFGRDRSTNGVDDDGNGYIDDVHGWNFAGGNNNLKDNHGHGTHIAGIIGAVGGNGIGISGVSPQVSLMVLKYFDAKAKSIDQVSATVKAIRYATQMGARIINYSAGGLERNEAEELAIRDAQKSGVLFVAAAGNERSNSDVAGYFPADYDLSNILSITAIDPERSVLSTSNYGARTVDLAAPGLEILSTLPGGRYGFMSGTSQATAFASGVAALLLAQQRDDLQKPEELIRYLVRTGDKSSSLRGLTKYQSVLNSYKALAIMDRGIAASGVSSANTAAMDTTLFLSRPALTTR